MKEKNLSSYPVSLSILPHTQVLPWHSASMGSYSLEEELSWASPLSSTDSVFNHTSFTQPQEITHEQEGDNYQEEKSIPQSTLPSGSKLMLFKYISG